MDDVLIDAPYVITQEMIASLKIHLVVHGASPEAAQADVAVTPAGLDPDPYALPRKMGILKVLPVITTSMTGEFSPLTLQPFLS